MQTALPPFTLAMLQQSRIQGARYHLARMQAARADAEARYADQPYALQAERTFWARAEANAEAALRSTRALALCNDDADAALALQLSAGTHDALDAKLTALEAADALQVAA